MMYLIGWLQATLCGLFSVASMQVDSDNLYVFSTEVKSVNAMSTCITVPKTLHICIIHCPQIKVT